MIPAVISKNPGALDKTQNATDSKSMYSPTVRPLPPTVNHLWGASSRHSTAIDRSQTWTFTRRSDVDDLDDFPMRSGWNDASLRSESRSTYQGQGHLVDGGTHE